MARTLRLSKTAYPLALLALAIGLTIAGLSGTSIGVIANTQPGHNPSLITGTPRPIRWDEWNVTTPLIVAQSHHDFTRYTQDGLGPHDLTVILDVPNRDWSSAFKPWDLPMLVLDLEHGFAARWWMMSLLLLVGVYLLLLELTGRVDVSIFFSLGLWLSPFFHWWYQSITLDSVAMGTLVLVFFLYAIRSKRTLFRVLFILLAAYSTISFSLLLYPPFQVPIAIVLGAVGLFEVVTRVRGGEARWQRPVADAVVVGVLAAVVLVAFYMHTRTTLHAVTGTVYPGKRRVTGGGTSVLQLFSAPFGVPLAVNGATLAQTNQSEISSFLLLGPFALLQAFRIRLADIDARLRLPFIGAAVGFLIVAAWYLISLPPFVASVLLLDRAEADRTLLGVGVGGFLLMALFCAARLTPGGVDDTQLLRTPAARTLRQRVATGAVVCGILAFVAYFWAGRQLAATFSQLHLSLWEVGLFSAAAAVVVLLLSARKVVLGGIAMVALGAVISLPANPLYQGLGPLTSSPLLPVFNRVADHPADPSNDVWVSYAGPNVNDVLLASGLPTLNAEDIYPVHSAWHILDPTGKSTDAWNRYANVVYEPGAPGSAPAITLIQQDAVKVTFDPCGSAAAKLHIGFVVSPSPVTASCLAQAVKTTYEGAPLYVYAKTAQPSNG
ncbi:MAG TPA: hypothetical protein VHB02_07050 [Acidimicrobiales bacterium]|nr:hypothetical protein [Acidimicrobiales bacterium]